MSRDIAKGIAAGSRATIQLAALVIAVVSTVVLNNNREDYGESFLKALRSHDDRFSVATLGMRGNVSSAEIEYKIKGTSIETARDDINNLLKEVYCSLGIEQLKELKITHMNISVYTSKRHLIISRTLTSDICT